MSRLTRGLAGAISCLALTTAAFAGGPPVFTGNVPADFTSTQAVTIADGGGVGDVGVPANGGPCPNVPGGTGWDISGLKLQYDRLTDTLYVGIDFVAIAGDVDNDGDPGTSSPGLTCRGGIDFANLGDSECIAMAFDTNLDGLRDVIVGVSGLVDITGFTAATYVEPNPPPFAFGAPIPGATLFTPIDAAHPDFEFSIANFSQLPGLGSPDPVNGTFKFAVSTFAGSLADDGYGEDNTNPNLVTLLCTGFDDQESGTEINTQYSSSGVVVDGISHSAFPGAFTARPTDDPSMNDNLPVNPPNMLKTKQDALDLTSDTGFINFHFVSPLDGITSVGATTASLWFIDVESSGGGVPDGSYYNAFDGSNSNIGTIPIPAGGNGQAQFFEFTSASGDIHSVQADLGFSNGFDSCSVDALCANLNPIPLPAAGLAGGSYAITAEQRNDVIVDLNTSAREIDIAQLVFQPEGQPEVVLFQKTNVHVANTRNQTRRITKSLLLHAHGATGSGRLFLRLINPGSALVNPTTVSSSFSTATVQ
ncbi:MAG: hypothetical protein HYR85_07080 [Planctomycetes bacterium]|nr:hypothetical protein [Planctomycetota bacterium]MBI3843848.1 hypothetical protein [Planctomycetota bacterium]